MYTFSLFEVFTVFSLNHHCFFKNGTYVFLSFTISISAEPIKLCLHEMILQYSAFAIILLSMSFSMIITCRRAVNVTSPLCFLFFFHSALFPQTKKILYICIYKCDMLQIQEVFLKRLHWGQPRQVSAPEHHCSSSSASLLPLTFIKREEKPAGMLAWQLRSFFLFLTL